MISCQDCRYWVATITADGIYGIGGPHTDGSVSECRRFAPTACDSDRRARMYPNASRVFPETHRADWCGEFEPRENEANTAWYLPDTSTPE